ncbi:hypothetical protein KUL113_03790 [Tenacibaculum sp. KUL113]|nr:hypothetical protein KUL113_03790 [Tenacibaculum sp. KUL113]
MEFKNVRIQFGWNKPVVVLQYGTLQYEIGTLELKGVTLMQLGSLNPEHVAKHHQMLLVCEMSTTIRLAKTDVPEPVNTCSRKLFDETALEQPKVALNTNLSA